MSVVTLVYAALIAAAYVFWPIIGKWSGASGGWISTIVIGGSLIPIIALGYRQLANGPVPSLKAFSILAIAGVLNGAAVYVYGSKAADPAVPSGVFLATVYVCMILLAPIADGVFNHGALSAKQYVGVALALGAVYFLAVK